ncbi:MAG: DUF2065 domain-containing protein [Gammaproteobacteria bacterium]
MWHDLLAALGLMLVIEGIAPFANPGGLRNVLALAARLDDASLRLAGLVSMLLGVALLYVIR